MEFTLEQLKVGDRPSWDLAFNCFYGLVVNVLSGGTNSICHADLEDIAIESITKLIESYVDKATSLEELKKLVITIAKNQFKDLLERLKAKKRGSGAVESLQDQPEGTDFASSSQSPDQDAQTAEISILVNEALNQIPEKYRDVVKDRYLLDMTQQEIAQKRGLKIGSIGVYINRGIEALEPILKKFELL